MPNLNREERIRQLLEQSQALRERRPRAMQADLDSQLLGNMGYNFAQIGQAFSPTAPDRKDYASTYGSSDALAKQEQGLQGDIANLRNEAVYDPNSPISKLATKAYAQQSGLPEETFSGINAKELGTIPGLSKVMTPPKVVQTPEQKVEQEIKKSKEIADYNLKNQKDLIDYKLSKENEKVKSGLKKEVDEKFIETQANKIPAALKDFVELDNKFKAVDDVLGKYGTSLDTYTKNVDLPGVSVPGIGRVEIGEEAANLRSAMQNILNQEIKDLSGAAVSNTEMKRIQKGFAQGSFNTEEQMIKAMQDYKKAVATALKNAKAGFVPEAVNRFTERGGSIPNLESKNVAGPANPQKKPQPKNVSELSQAQRVQGLLEAKNMLNSPDPKVRAIGQQLINKFNAAGVK